VAIPSADGLDGLAVGVGAGAASGVTDGSVAAVVGSWGFMGAEPDSAAGAAEQAARSSGAARATATAERIPRR